MAWNGLWFVIALIASVFSIIEMSRHRGETGEYVYYRGVPRFMRWFVPSDEAYAKDIERQKIAKARDSQRRK